MTRFASRAGAFVAALTAALMLAAPAQAAAPSPAPAKTAVPLRATTLTTPIVSVAGYGLVWFSVTAAHATPSGLKPSTRSPIWVQRWTGTRWTTVRTLTTDSRGFVAAAIAAPGGRQKFRAYRPVGATVTAASSRVVVAWVPDPAGEGPLEVPGSGD